MFDSKLSHSLRHSSTLYVINANVMQNFSAVTLCFVELFGLLGLVIKSAPPPPTLLNPLELKDTYTSDFIRSLGFNNI